MEWQVTIRLPFDAAKEDAYIVFCKRMLDRVRDWEALWPIWVHDGQKWWQEISMSGFLALDAEDNEEGAHAALTQLTKDKLAVALSRELSLGRPPHFTLTRDGDSPRPVVDSPASG